MADCQLSCVLTGRPLKVVWVDPPALQANISLLTNPVDDNFVSVTAVVLEEDSQPSQGTTFSYSSTSLVKHKCEFLLVETHIW